MNKRTVHFVYAVPQRRTPLRHAYDAVCTRMARATGRTYTPWRYGDLHYDRRLPLHSPISITVSLLQHLQKSYRVLLYDWLETGVPPCYGPDDIIIGHLAPQPTTPMQRFVTCDKPAAAKILIEPFAFRLLEDTAFILPALPKVDAFAAICGPYWIDRLAESPFEQYRELIHRVDMAIDIRDYPCLKRSFGAYGKRRFLYIGHNRKPAKGCSYLSVLAASLPDVEFAWIGSGPEIPYVRRISSGRALTPAYMKTVCEQFDFLITMGVSDANPTTVLEAMAWGLPVVCTPQSGYCDPEEVFNVELDDMNWNIALIKKLQELSASDLLEISNRNRQRVASHYTWDRFHSTVDLVINDGLQLRQGLKLSNTR